MKRKMITKAELHEQRRREIGSLRILNQVPEFASLKVKQKRFLMALALEDGCIERASKRCGIPWTSHFRWRKTPEYQAGIDVAFDVLANALVSVMLGDAVHGREVPIVFKGMVTGYRREVYPQERNKLLEGLDKRFASVNFQVSTGPVQVNIGYSSPPPDMIDVSPVIPDKSDT